MPVLKEQWNETLDVRLLEQLALQSHVRLVHGHLVVKRTTLLYRKTPQKMSCTSALRLINISPNILYF